MPNNTSCPKCGQKGPTRDVGWSFGSGRLHRFQCGTEQGNEEGRVVTIGRDCLTNQLATERARLAQVKAWTTKVHPLPAERTLEAVGQCIELVIKNLEALDRIPSDTPEVLAVVECRICPNCKVWGIDDFVHLDGCNRVGVEGTITVTARTEGGESEWDLGATAQGRSSVK